MKPKITDMCIFSERTQCFFIFGDVVDVGAGKLAGLPVKVLYHSLVGSFRFQGNRYTFLHSSDLGRGTRKVGDQEEEAKNGQEFTQQQCRFGRRVRFFHAVCKSFSVHKPLCVRACAHKSCSV